VWPVSTFEKRKKGKTFFVSTFLDCYILKEKSLGKVETLLENSLGKVGKFKKVP